MKIIVNTLSGTSLLRLIILILVFFSLQSISQESSLPKININKTQNINETITADALPYITFVTEDLPPFQFIENNEVVGFATDIVKLVMSKLPYQYEIVLYPWSRAYQQALNKENTCIYSIARSPERESKFIWIESFAQRGISFIGLSNNKSIKINSIEDAKKYRVAVIKDDLYHQLLIKHGFTESKNLFVVNSTYSILKLLKQRENIDLIIEDPFIIHFNSEKNSIDPNDFKVFYEIKSEPLQYYLACQLDTPPTVIDNLYDTFKKLKLSNGFDDINAKWQFDL